MHASHWCENLGRDAREIAHAVGGWGGTPAPRFLNRAPSHGENFLGENRLIKSSQLQGYRGYRGLIWAPCAPQRQFARRSARPVPAFAMRSRSTTMSSAAGTLRSRLSMRHEMVVWRARRTFAKLSERKTEKIRARKICAASERSTEESNQRLVSARSAWRKFRLQPDIVVRPF